MITPIAPVTDMSYYIITIAGALIVLLMGGISYFLREFAISVNNIKSTVDKLMIMISVEQEKVTNTRESLLSTDQKITILIDKLDELEKEINTIKQNIAVLKALDNERNDK
jgi:hypothetical protein